MVEEMASLLESQPAGASPRIGQKYSLGLERSTEMGCSRSLRAGGPVLSPSLPNRVLDSAGSGSGARGM